MSTDSTTFLSVVLQNTLNPDKATRKQAEDTLKQLRIQPQFAVSLLQFIISNVPTESVKQAAAVYFKNMTGNHWSPTQDDFHISDAEKAEVRRVIVDCMISCTTSQIRTILSDAIARICEFDFPTLWPSLVTDLVTKLKSTTDLQTIAGVLYTAHSIFKRYRLVMELKKETQQEILQVIQEFAPTMLELFEKLVLSTSQPGVGKETLEQLIMNINLLIELYYDLNCVDISDWFLAHMSRFMGLFLKCMQFDFPALSSLDDERPSLLDQTKAVVIQCITLCLEKFDEDFQPFVENFTVAIWDLLQTLQTTPRHDELCIAAMAFLTGISRTIYHKLLADPIKQKMICEKIIIPNMELRNTDIEMFEDDPQEYIRRDIEGSDSDTRRRSACDLIQGLSKNYEMAISEIFQQYVHFLMQQYSSNPSNNWKFKDTAIYLITALSVRGTTAALQQVYVNVWLRDVPKVSDRIPRKLCVVALTHMLASCQWMTQLAATTAVTPSNSPLLPPGAASLATPLGSSAPGGDPFAEVWGNTVTAVLKLLELGVEQEQTDGKTPFMPAAAASNLIQDRSEEGYSNVYCPLAAATAREEDPCTGIPDEGAYFAATLRQAFATNPQYRERCHLAAKALPSEVITRLQQRGIV